MTIKLFLFAKRYAKRLAILLIIVTLIKIDVIIRGGKNTDNDENINEDSWVDHLCPKYRLRDASSEVKLEWRNPDTDTIYFTDTSCGIGFGGRQACAVESAARHHPEKTIQLMTTAPTLNMSLPLFKVLLELPNVKVSWMDLGHVFSSSPLQEWHQNRRWMFVEERRSIFVSDAARVELLRRFGGTYLDLDILTLRPLPIHSNYIGRVDPKQLNGAVMSFRPHHDYVKSIVDDLPKVFDPFKCCTIGPDLLTSHLHRLCPKNFTIPKATDTDAMETCTDVTVYPSPAFYPIYWLPGEENIQSLFISGRGLGRKFLKETKSYALHLYNSLSKQDTFHLGGDSILETVAKINCPDVYNVMVKYKMPL